MANKRIGVYGGSFDPVHNGHVELVKAVLTMGLVDEVIVTVSPWNPFKKNDGVEPVPYEDRFKMTSAAFKGVDNVYVSKVESTLGETSKTYNTLKKLDEMYCGIKGVDYAENVELVAIVGGDTWAQIDKFYEFEKLVKEYEFIVMQRGSSAIVNALSVQTKKVTFISWTSPKISSTDIRSRVGQGLSIHEYVCEDVYHTILQKRFYRRPIMEIVNGLFELLEAAGFTISTAESCTGGLISATMTEVPGSSIFCRGGVVSYSTHIKETVLGVDPKIIREHTVVSMEVASAMAVGVSKLMESECAISVTGYAGPNDEESGKIYVCAFLNGFSTCVVNLNTKINDRQLNREIAVIRGLSLMHDVLTKYLKSTK